MIDYTKVKKQKTNWHTSKHVQSRTYILDIYLYQPLRGCEEQSVRVQQRVKNSGIYNTVLITI